MTKNYKAAPLPFIGQKRLFLKDFKAMLAEIEGDGEGWTIVDVFGGSGLLAHTAKRAKPKARVIYNDYDNYSERLANIDSTNALRREIHRLLAPMPKDGSLSAEIAGQIRTAILAHQAAARKNFERARPVEPCGQNRLQRRWLFRRPDYRGGRLSRAAAKIPRRQNAVCV